MAQRAKKTQPARQREEKKESKEESIEGELRLEDIVQEMLEEGPIIFTEEAAGSPEQK